MHIILNFDWEQGTRENFYSALQSTARQEKEIKRHTIGREHRNVNCVYDSINIVIFIGYVDIFKMHVLFVLTLGIPLP